MGRFSEEIRQSKKFLVWDQDKTREEDADTVFATSPETAGFVYSSWDFEPRLQNPGDSLTALIKDAKTGEVTRRLYTFEECVQGMLATQASTTVSRPEWGRAAQAVL